MNKKNSYLLILLPLFFFTACATSQDTKLDFEKPDIQIPKPQAKVHKKKGSLYARKGTSLFADKKDLQIGDIIQVIVSENLNKDAHNKRELTNDRTHTLGGGLVTPMAGNTAGLGGVTDNIATNANKLLGANFNTTSKDDFKGEVKSYSKESFSTKISVIIEEVYQNGNYFIRGSKEMLLDKQLQKIKISGVIRPYDISPDNSIQSSQVANLKVLYNKAGDDQEVMHEGWGYKLLKAIWPF